MLINCVNVRNFSLQTLIDKPKIQNSMEDFVELSTYPSSIIIIMKLTEVTLLYTYDEMHI